MTMTILLLIAFAVWALGIIVVFDPQTEAECFWGMVLLGPLGWLVLCIQEAPALVRWIIPCYGNEDQDTDNEPQE